MDLYLFKHYVFFVGYSLFQYFQKNNKPKNNQSWEQWLEMTSLIFLVNIMTFKTEAPLGQFSFISHRILHKGLQSYVLFFKQRRTGRYKEKDLRVQVDGNLDMSQRCTLISQKVNCILDSTKRSVASSSRVILDTLQ